MSFAKAAARLQEAVFGRLGEDAAWEGVAGTVRVRRIEADDQVDFERGAVVATGRSIRVRRFEVPSPREGQIVQVLDEAGAAVPEGRLAVSGEPVLDRKGIWTCAVEPAAE